MATIYATASEFQNFPSGLEVADLVAGGTPAQQAAELALILQQASSAIDQWTYQPLYAHTSTETIHARPGPYGTLTVRVSQFPLVSVTSAQWRQTPRGGWNAIDLTMIDVFGALGEGHKYVAGDTNYAVRGGWGLAPLTVQSTYVAGYPNMLLTVASAAATTTLTVDTVLGVQDGQILSVYDGANYEVITVASASGSTLTLSAPTVYAHGVGVRISAVPDAVNLACLLTAAYLLKERRTAGFVMGGKIQSTNMLTAEDLQLARQYLQPFRRVI